MPWGLVSCFGLAAPTAHADPIVQSLAPATLSAAQFNADFTATTGVLTNSYTFMNTPTTGVVESQVFQGTGAYAGLTAYAYQFGVNNVTDNNSQPTSVNSASLQFNATPVPVGTLVSGANSSVYVVTNGQVGGINVPQAAPGSVVQTPASIAWQPGTATGSLTFQYLDANANTGPLQAGAMSGTIVVLTNEKSTTMPFVSIQNANPQVGYPQAYAPTGGTISSVPAGSEAPSPRRSSAGRASSAPWRWSAASAAAARRPESARPIRASPPEPIRVQSSPSPSPATAARGSSPFAIGRDDPAAVAAGRDHEFLTVSDPFDLDHHDVSLPQAILHQGEFSVVFVNRDPRPDRAAVDQTKAEARPIREYSVSGARDRDRVGLGLKLDLGPPELAGTQPAVGVIQVDLYPHGPIDNILGDSDPRDVPPVFASREGVGAIGRRIADIDLGNVAIRHLGDDPHGTRLDDGDDRRRAADGRRADELAGARVAAGDEAIDRGTNPGGVPHHRGSLEFDICQAKALLDFTEVGLRRVQLRLRFLDGGLRDSDLHLGRERLGFRGAGSVLLLIEEALLHRPPLHERRIRSNCFLR